MSQAEKQSPARTGDSRVEELKSSAHLMTLETGIYCIVNGSPQPSAGTISGVRVSLTNPADHNVAVSSFRPDGWLNAAGDAALVRVLSGPAQVMVTIYQSEASSDAAPKIRVLRLSESAPAGSAAPAETPAIVARRPVMILTEAHDVIAHVQRTGDVGVAFGAWVGTPGSQFAVEGFSLRAPEGLTPSDLTYQAVLGRGWLSPWSEAGQFCGSRGMALPLLGMKVKLSDSAAKRFDLTYEASFVDGSRVGPLHSEESCETEGLSPLEAIRVTLVAKAAKTEKKIAPATVAPAPAKVAAKTPEPPAKPAAKAKASAEKPPAAPVKPILRRR